MTFVAASLVLADENATKALARDIAAVAKPGDVFLLAGDIGAGKSTFARAFIQHRLGSNQEVPSPTFTLVQTYEHSDADIWHCDLYRLSHPDEVYELGLEEAYSSAICLIEWPDRLGTTEYPAAQRLRFKAGHDSHSVEMEMTEEFQARKARKS